MSLGYQVMWFRLYADRFGSTNLTFLLVVTSFIGGLALGSLSSRRLTLLAGRWRPLRHPLVLVGAIELLVAATALLTLAVDPSGIAAGGGFPYRPDARGIHEPVLVLRLAGALAAALMLVPTFLMGMTFPLLCAAFRGRDVFPSELYAWNTAGACSGVLLAEFVLLAQLGHTRAFVVLAALNAALALVFVAIARGYRRADAEPPRARPPRGRLAPFAFRPAVVLAVAALSGFVSGALEVDMFRAVRFAGAITDAAMSFTSFWAIVAIFAAAATVRALARPRPWLIRAALPAALAVYGLTWWQLPALRGFFNARYMAWVAAHAPAGADMTGVTIYPLSASLPLLLAFTGVVVFPSYYLVSLLLPTVCNVVQGDRAHLGRAYGLNTLAFCLGAVLFTWAAPSVSLFYAVKLLFVVMAAGAVLALLLRPGRALPRAGLAAALAIVAVGVLLVPRGFDRGFFPDDELPARFPVSSLKSNGAHTTYVVEHPRGNILYFDSHPMSGTWPSAQRYMRLMAHMPLLAQQEPRRALLICFGVGNTAQAIAAHRSIEAIDIVDLNDKVFETADAFVRTNGDVHRDPRVRLIHDDGRGYLRRTRQTYDLVTSEPPPPRSAGVYRLYSVEYYRDVLDRLTPDGMMTQWLPVNALSGEAADRIVASFVAVFPHVLLFVGSEDQLILMGGRRPFDPALLERRFIASPGARGDLLQVGVETPVQLLARITRMEDDLRGDVAGVRPVSDERNDLALAVTDPFDPPLLAFEPRAVLAALEPERLVCGERLAEVLRDPRRLRAAVPDFPVTARTP